VVVAVSVELTVFFNAKDAKGRRGRQGIFLKKKSLAPSSSLGVLGVKKTISSTWLKLQDAHFAADIYRVAQSCMMHLFGPADGTRDVVARREAARDQGG
jgi:hypothetical protein